MKRDFVFMSESVTEGHPDKLCDQISDAVVDRFLEQDRYSRVIAECAVSGSILFIAARFASDAAVDFPSIARKVIRQVGYDRSDFNGKTCSILTGLNEMPISEHCCFNDREMSEEAIDLITAGNHVTVFGFACRQTPELMPMPIQVAHRICARISKVRRDRVIPYLCPEGKANVGIEYKNRAPYRVHSITITASHLLDVAVDMKTLREAVQEFVIGPVFENETVRPDDKTEIFINPDGQYPLGGPTVHSGLTGRKNAIDTYGEYSRHSGAALSGKDPLRIDRIGAYAARYAAKNIVAAGLADECEVMLSYSISRARPAGIQVETFGTGKRSDAKLAALIERCFDFRLAGIIRTFQLRDLPARSKGNFYQRLAAYGHMGRMDVNPPWEATDRVEELLEHAAAPSAKSSK